MKLKTFSTMALSLLIGGATLVSDAKGRTESVSAVAASDLEVTVQAFEDEFGQRPIANGSTAFDKSAVWMSFTVKNKGLGNAGKFTFKAMIYQNGGRTAAPAAETITLESHQSRTLPMVRINTLGRSEQISARMIADIGNFIKETNEANNKMEMSFRVANNF
jgi:subtilase family serine protease